MESAGHIFSAFLRAEKAKGRRLPDAEQTGLAEREAGPRCDLSCKEGRLVVPPLPHPARGDGHRDKEGLPRRSEYPLHGKGHPSPVPVCILLPPLKLEPIDRGRKASVGKGPGPPHKRVGCLPDHGKAFLLRKCLRHCPAGITDEGRKRAYRPVTDRASPREEEILRRIEKLAGCHEFCPLIRSGAGSPRCLPPCHGRPSHSR